MLNKEVRKFEISPLIAEAEDMNEEMIVEGYAAVFDSPTVLFQCGDTKYYETIDKKAFDGADLSDVIFQYNHEGKVLARTRNSTLEIQKDNKGLKIRAKLEGTKSGQELYEEIKGGYIDKMSFAFSVREDSYDVFTNTRKILRIDKLYDVSAVSIPAYNDTSIVARNFESLEKEIKEKESRKLKLKLLTML